MDHQPSPREAPAPALTAQLTAARFGNHDEFSQMAEPYRRELQAYGYRMLGSLQDAEDLVQETFLRAWRRLDTYEGRAPFRAWLYKIATHLCLDSLARRPRRALPALTHPAADPQAQPAQPIEEPVWLEPIPDDLTADPNENPEARYSSRESVTLAFLAALQALPPRQRAVLILCDVLDWRAGEAAQMLGMTTAAVNSALHRARVTSTRRYGGAGLGAVHAQPPDETTHAILSRYVRAWESADVDGLVALIKGDATFAMPPTPSWYQG